MVKAVIILLALLALLLALWKLLGFQILGRNQGRQDFEHFIMSLLVLMENGGLLHVQHRGTAINFDLVRESGTGTDDAVVVLRFPRAVWSNAYEEKLLQVFDSQQFEVNVSTDPASETILDVRIPVENIWEEEWCGARAARAAHLLLDTLCVPRNARFDFTFVGERSARGLEKERQLRKQFQA